MAMLKKITGAITSVFRVAKICPQCGARTLVFGELKDLVCSRCGAGMMSEEKLKDENSTN